MPLLDMQHLSVRYESRRHRPLTAVEDVSFTIDDGEFVGLIGESGSGKTTLGMALLRLLERPGRIVDGSILFDGRDITAPDSGRAPVNALAGHLDGLPVVDELAQSRRADRGAVSRRHRIPHEASWRGGHEAGPRTLRHGLHRPDVHQRVPARALRRDEAAGQPRDGARDRAEVRRARRADHRPGRGRPARDPRERAPSPARAGVRRPLHQPRHRHRPRPVGPDPRHVCGPRSSRSRTPTRSSTIRCTRTPRA